MTPSFRAQLTTRRTYNRPLDKEGKVFETWEQTVDRVIGHQSWLWARAKGDVLSDVELAELSELRTLLLDRKVSVSGRTLWLGGTDVSKRREASQFNCSFEEAANVYDMVDGFWLLLQGCGLGFKPINGILNGFTNPVADIEVIRSTRTVADWEAGVRGRETNVETFENGVWTLSVGDSAEAWAKSLGKILVMKMPARKIVLDFREIRAPGIRLNGYGWISSGDEKIAEAYEAICRIMSRAAGRLLTKIDILDIMNWLGRCLSSRRAAEICVMEFMDPEAETFTLAKKDMYDLGNYQREQSNNSLLFYHKPSRLELQGIFKMMMDAGGSEPGFINAANALRRAPWFKGVNPCVEILLGNKSFCNLVEIDLGKFIGDFAGLLRAGHLISRANYRQTCVNLKDGVLSESWHELNEFLRLCGVGLTGIVKWLDQEANVAERLGELRENNRNAAIGMADALGLPRPKLVTTVKPSGTLSKIMDTTEGAHRPLGEFIFNNMNFGIHDPLVDLLVKANYHVEPNPVDESCVLVRLPVSHKGVTKVGYESAVEQLDRYKLLMDNYVDHNCSVTISYDPSEVNDIVNWLDKNWDSYVGVSFLYRNDPTKTAQDLGYAYLPQEVVDEETYNEYVAWLRPIDLDAIEGEYELENQECATGGCPVR